MKTCRKCESIAKWRVTDCIEIWPGGVYACSEHVERYLTNGCIVYTVLQTRELSPPLPGEHFGTGGHSDGDTPPPMGRK